MNDKIVNVYEFHLEDGREAFIYSQKKKENPLGFYYYILTRNDNNEPIRYDAGNTIMTLTNNGVHLQEIKKEDSQYAQFLKDLLYTLNHNQKEREFIRK